MWVQPLHKELPMFVLGALCVIIVSGLLYITYRIGFTAGQSHKEKENNQ